MLDESGARRAAAELRGAPADAILQWAIDRFPGRAALSVSFGGGGVLLAHMLSTIDRSVPVLFIDTGFLFPETLEFKNDFVARYGLTVRELKPAYDPGPLYERDPDACCRIRRVEPLERALVDYDAWVSALRRDQSPARAATEVVEYHESDGRPVIKVHPLAQWTRADVWQYLRDHNVPYHPLLDQGYTSIGCWPCTHPNTDASDERAGRWTGTGKTECGLHTFTRTQRVSSGES